jgi:hypothetical protein
MRVFLQKPPVFFPPDFNKVLECVTRFLLELLSVIFYENPLSST